MVADAPPHRVAASMLTLLIACTAVPLTDTDVAPEPPVAVAALWDDTAPSGRITLEETIITSRRSAAGTHAYAQAPWGGDQACLRIDIPTLIMSFPPPVGTPVQLTGSWVRGRNAPVITVDDLDDVVILGEPEPPIVTPWSTELELGGCLVSAEDLTVTSGVDPAGNTDTDGPVSLGGTFAFTPGYGTIGDAAGLVTAPLTLSVRDPDGWSGEPEGLPPVPITPGASAPEGQWSVLLGVTQAAPWSRDGRWTVVQDDTGAGLWVDVEGWQVSTDSQEGDRLDWTGESRTAPRRLRTWLAPEVIGVAEVRTVDTEVDGARITLALDTLGPTADDGTRDAGEWTLDDRFVDLSGLTAPVTVTGVVLGETRLAVIEWD